MRSVPRPCCWDADAVLVMPVAVDEKYEMAEMTVRSSGVRDAVLALDEDAQIPWAERLGHVVRCQGFGVGKALDAAYKYALQLGAEWIVRSDSHVYFAEPAWVMLRPEYSGVVVLPPHRPADSGIVTHGLVLDHALWILLWNYKPFRPLPCVMDPVFATHSSLVRELLRWQPWVYAVPYWGKENFDFTLSLAQLGHPVLPVDRPLVVHHYKKEWPKARVERRCIEPWCGELAPGENPYFASMGIADAIFAVRHYERPQAYRFWREIGGRWVGIAARYFPDRFRYARLKYTVEQVYRAWPAPP